MLFRGAKGDYGGHLLFSSKHRPLNAENVVNTENTVRPVPDKSCRKMSPPVALRQPTILADVFGALMVRVLGIVLLFASTTLAARLLGAEEYGTYCAAMSLAILLGTLAPIGSDRLLVRNLSTANTTTEAGRETALTHHCTGAVALLIFVMSLVSVGAGDLFGVNDAWKVTIFLSAIMFMPIALTYLRQWVAIPLVGTRHAVMPEQILLPVAFIAALIGLRLIKYPLTAFSASMAYAVVMLLVWCGSLLNAPIRRAYTMATTERFDAGAIASRLHQGIPFAGVALGNVMLQKCLPLVIAATCGFYDTAQFAIALNYANLAGIPLGILNLSVIPRCSRHVQRGDYQQAGRVVSATATLTLLMSTAIGIMTWWMAPVVVHLLGTSYSAISVILPTLVLAAIVDSMPGPSVSLLQSMHLENEYSRAMLAFIPLQLLMVYGMSIAGGLSGAAVGYLLSRILWNILIVGIIWRFRGVLTFPRFSPVWLMETFRQEETPVQAS